MPRLTGEQLRAAKAAKRLELGKKLVQACLGEEADINAAMEEIDQVFFAAIEFAMWLWFNEILPKHFGPGALQKYGYPLRKEGYLIGKFVGKHMRGGVSRFRFPKQVAYRMAAGGKDPYPLEFTGNMKVQTTRAPASVPRVVRMTGGYRGSVVISVGAFIRRDDINALLRYIPEDTEMMMNAVNAVVSGAFNA
jgi:hypothetical protein